jgi:hypothetical protein
VRMEDGEGRHRFVFKREGADCRPPLDGGKGAANRWREGGKRAPPRDRGSGDGDGFDSGDGGKMARPTGAARAPVTSPPARNPVMAHRSNRASSPRDHRRHPVASSLFDCRPLPFLARKKLVICFSEDHKSTTRTGKNSIAARTEHTRRRARRGPPVRRPGRAADPPRPSAPR